jgi:DNA-binding HxlR family transcriptional regulator
VTGGRYWWSRRCPAGRSDSNDLLGQIPGIAANILSERFKRLGREGLLMARPYSERPPRAAYQLTAEGTELAGALRLLAYWGAKHADPIGSTIGSTKA